MKLPFTVVMTSADQSAHYVYHGEHKYVEDAMKEAKQTAGRMEGIWGFTCVFAGIQHPLQFDEEEI